MKKLTTQLECLQALVDGLILYNEDDGAYVKIINGRQHSRYGKDEQWNKCSFVFSIPSKWSLVGHNGPNTLISSILNTSIEVVNHRNLLEILAHTTEEIGELSQEILIDGGLSYKDPGPDGIIGEALDAIICLVDLIYQYDNSITESALIDIADHKLNKWKNKYSSQ